MRSRHLLWAGAGVVGAAGVLGGAWMLSLPETREFRASPAIGVPETQALLAALKPPTNPAVRYVGDRRIVVDDGVATTTGISACQWL